MRNETGETPSTGQRLISTVEIKPHGGCQTTLVLQSVMGVSFGIDLNPELHRGLQCWSAQVFMRSVWILSPQ